MKCLQKICEKSVVITDGDTGEVLCSNCGSVLAEKTETFGPEHTVHNVEQYMQRSRSGSKTTLAIDDMGLSTVIGPKNQDVTGKTLTSDMRNTFNRLRVWDSRSKSKSTERSLRTAFVILNNVKEKLAIPDTVIEKAAYTYRKALTKKMTRGGSISALVAASLYVACKEAGVPRTIKDIAKASNGKAKDISKHLRLLVEKLDLKLPTFDSSDFVSRIASTLEIGQKSQREALLILASAKEKGLADGKNPIAMAATSLYISAAINGESKSQRQIANASGISEVTIRSRARSLIENLGLQAVA